MTRTLAIVVYSGMLACLSLPAQETQPARPGAGLPDRFRQLDRNGDGRVARDEARAMPIFDAWDADKDGAVTLEEVQAFYTKRQADAGTPAPRPAATRPAPATPPVPAADGFVPDAPFVGEGNGSYIDPEFSEEAGQVVFQDAENRVWIGDLDPETGLFRTATGRDHLVDEDITIVFDRPPQGRKFSTNGPEWTGDERGHFVVYTKADAAGVMQQCMARLVDGKAEVAQLTRGETDCYGNMPSRFRDGKPPRISYTYDWPIWKAKAAWIFADRPGEPHELEGFDYRQMSMWSAVSPEFLFIRRPEGASHGQVARSNADTGEVTVLTGDEGAKDDPGLFRAPEFGGEVLLVCNVDNRALAVYRDLARDGRSPWTRIATLTLPADAPYGFVSSPEAIAPATGVRGVSYFALLAREGKDRTTPGSIWVLGFGTDPERRFARRVDDGARTGEAAALLEPEPFVGTREVFVYYNHFALAGGRRGLRRASTGIAVAGPATRETGALFRRVEVPGFTDIEEGTNGIALADLDRDGRLDVVATYSEPNSWRKPDAHRLRVFRNRGGFRLEERAITIRGSDLTGERFGLLNEVPHLADLDGDGYLDLFVTRSAPMLAGKPFGGIGSIGNTLLLSDGSWDRFRDVSARLGATNATGYNRQGSLADVNADGWLDIAIGCDNIGNGMGGLPWSRLYLFRPGGERFEDGRFEDIGGTDLVPDFGGFYHDAARDRAGPMVSLRDLDGDGDLDLLQSCHVDVRQPLLPYSPGEYRQGVFTFKSLLAETGEMRFEKATGNGLACEARLRYDREREIYVPVGKAPGLPYVFFADVDNDARPDVLAIGPSDPGWAPRAEAVGGRFWRNVGGFRFEEATAAAGLDALNRTYREWYRFFDVPIPAEIEARRPRQPNYLSQPGLPQRHPLDDRFYHAGAIFGDFDNDGWIDFVALDRHEQPIRPDYRAVLFRNRSDGTFEPMPTAWSGIDGTGITGETADLDGDGLLDLVIARDPDNSGGGLGKPDGKRYRDLVFANTGAAGARKNHWLRLRFSGIRHAALIGARVEAREPGTRKLLGARWVFANHGYKSGCALETHFGLGRYQAVDLAVALPGGRAVRFDGVRGDRSLDLDLAGAKVSEVTAGR